jgi:glycine/D-amino acid oxidase-like deaminating enzyme
VIGLSAARALAQDGFAVTVFERHTVGTQLGSSPGRSRIYRRAYHHPDYVALSAAAIRLWEQIDRSVLVPNGLLMHGHGVENWAAAMDEAGFAPDWLEPDDASRRFPEARFHGPVLWDADAGAVLADDALRALAAGLDVREGVASVIDRGHTERPLFYGLVAPGVGYKVAQDGVARPWDPDRPDRTLDSDQERRIADHVREWFPGLDPQPYAGEACLYTMTPDSDFVLDVIDGVVVVGGDSGHAFKLAPLLGRMAADLAQGRDLPSQANRFAAARLARP